MVLKSITRHHCRAAAILAAGMTLMLAEEATAAPADGDGYATQTLARLATVLSGRGWGTGADSAGNLLLFPTGMAAAGRSCEPRGSDPGTVAAEAARVSPAEETAKPEAAGERLAGLGDGLEAAGWMVEREPDGALRFHSWSPAPPVAREQARSAGETTMDSVLQVPRSEWLTGLGERLSQRGWEVEQATDGSLWLRLPRAPEPRIARAEPVVSTPSLPGLLASRGWDVRWIDGGGLLLYPRG